MQARLAMIWLWAGLILLIGVALLALLGPSFVVIPAGLLLPGTGFLWARRLLNRLEREVEPIALRRLGRDAGAEPGPGTVGH